MKPREHATKSLPADAPGNGPAWEKRPVGRKVAEKRYLCSGGPESGWKGPVQRGPESGWKGPVQRIPGSGGRAGQEGAEAEDRAGAAEGPDQGPRD